MTSTLELIAQLKSPKWGKRFEACEFLRVSNHLPEAARIALDAATHDPDQRVAEAAQLALRAHADRIESSEDPPGANTIPIAMGVVLTTTFGTLALLGLAIWISYITWPPSPYPMPDMAREAIYISIFCPAISFVLFACALYLGLITSNSYKARQAQASGSAAHAAVPPEGPES